MSWSILGENNHVFLFQLVLHSLQWVFQTFFTGLKLTFPSYASHFEQWSFLLLLWEIKSHHLKLCWTCQPKSVSPPAATRNSLCPPVMGEVTFLFPLNPTPLQEPCCLLLSLLFSFIFIHFCSLPPQPHPLSLLLFITYKPVQVCSKLKLHTPQAFTSLPLCCSTSWKHFFYYCHSHTHPSFLPNLFESHFHLSLHRPAPPCSSSSSIGPSWSWVPSENTFTHTLQAPPLPWASSACFLFWTFTSIWPIKVGFKLHFQGACSWVCFLLPLSIFYSLPWQTRLQILHKWQLPNFSLLPRPTFEIWNRGTNCHFVISTSNSGISKTEP